MLHQLTITCDYPAQLIGFHMQNSTDNTKLTFNALVPIEDSEEAVYAWGTPGARQRTLLTSNTATATQGVASTALRPRDRRWNGSRRCEYSTRC